MSALDFIDYVLEVVDDLPVAAYGAVGHDSFVCIFRAFLGLLEEIDLLVEIVDFLFIFPLNELAVIFLLVEFQLVLLYERFNPQLVFLLHQLLLILHGSSLHLLGLQGFTQGNTSFSCIPRLVWLVLRSMTSNLVFNGLISLEPHVLFNGPVLLLRFVVIVLTFAFKAKGDLFMIVCDL